MDLNVTIKIKNTINCILYFYYCFITYALSSAPKFACNSFVIASIVFFISSSVNVLSFALNISSYATLFLFSPNFSFLYISNSFAVSKMFFAFFDMSEYVQPVFFLHPCLTH